MNDHIHHADHDHASHNAHGHHAGHDHHAHIVRFRNRFWWSLLLTLPVLALTPAIQTFFGLSLSAPAWLVPVLATVVYFYGGWPFLKGAVDELKQHNPGMMTLIAVAITVAWSYSLAVTFGVTGQPFFWELVTLIDIMLLGHWIEMRSVMGAADALKALTRLMPHEAVRKRADGELETVPIEQLRPGDEVVVRPGSRIPVDGTVIEGRASVDQSMLTGESQPVPVETGQPVVGGSVAQDGLLVVKAEKLGADSFLAQMIELVEQAQRHRSRTQDLANRAARWLTVVALGAGAASLLGWTVAGASLAFAIERAVTVMIIACPHALGLAVPLVVAVSTARAARHGLLIRDRNAFEQARSLNTVVFDKTGTLTKGEFAVTDIIPLTAEVNADSALRWAAALEQGANHPLAHAVVKAAAQPLPPVRDFKALPGQGVQGSVETHSLQLLSPHALKAITGHDPATLNHFNALSEAGKTVVTLVRDNTPIALIALADQIRPEAIEAVERLHQLGLKVMMLTGDHPAAADHIARQLRLDGVMAQVLPAEKAARIQQLQQQGHKAAMVGDGVNDAPALAQADVGIAIGAGTDVAISAADIVLVHDNPADVVSLIRLSHATTAKMVQNLWWAAGYNIIAIPAAAGALAWAGILISPAVGAALMSLSTVIVAINAQLLWKKPI